MSLDENQDKRVGKFLRHLADKFEQKKLTSSQTQQTLEFVMNYLFDTYLEKEHISTTQNLNDHFEDGELLKFLVFGWFFYKVIQGENDLNSNWN